MRTVMTIECASLISWFPHAFIHFYVVEVPEPLQSFPPEGVPLGAFREDDDD